MDTEYAARLDSLRQWNAERLRRMAPEAAAEELIMAVSSSSLPQVENHTTSPEMDQYFGAVLRCMDPLVVARVYIQYAEWGHHAIGAVLELVHAREAETGQKLVTGHVDYRHPAPKPRKRRKAT